MPSVLQVSGLAHAARTHRPKGVHHLLVLPVSRQLGTRHWTLARLRLGPAQPVSQFQLDIRVARHLGGGGSWEQGTGRRQGSGSEPGRRSMSRSRATELPPPRAIPRARRLGYQVEIGRPAELARLGPVSAVETACIPSITDMNGKTVLVRLVSSTQDRVIDAKK